MAAAAAAEPAPGGRGGASCCLRLLRDLAAPWPTRLAAAWRRRRPGLGLRLGGRRLCPPAGGRGGALAAAAWRRLLAAAGLARPWRAPRGLPYRCRLRRLGGRRWLPRDAEPPGARPRLPDPSPRFRRMPSCLTPLTFVLHALRSARWSARPIARPAPRSEGSAPGNAQLSASRAAAATGPPI